jgi:hypothetical protein
VPIVRLKNKIVYFSHIPKCGGTSVESFLKRITRANLSILDRNFDKNTKVNWSISSPQHITGSYISQLFPITFFDEFFTVTRHPYERFSSAFLFQKYHTKKINQETDINKFVSKLDDHRALLPGQFDHHFLPQFTFLYPGASYKVFKLESGLDGVKKYLGSLLDIDVSNISMPHFLKGSDQIKLNHEPLNKHSKKIIMEIYKTDFEIFKYS